MTREEQIIKASQLYAKAQQKPFMDGARWADEHLSNPYKDVIEHMSSNTYRMWKQNLWHDAQGNVLPEIDREVIVLCGDSHGGYKVCFGHRPVESYTIINHNEMEKYYPERYGKGGWNIPDVRWWLDCNLPNMEEQK